MAFHICFLREAKKYARLARMNRHVRRIIVALSVFLWVLLAPHALLYIMCPIYRFQPKKPFSGDSWYNPYRNIEGNWYKANFHAHSRAWFGITAGRDERGELYEHYRRMGYDVIGLSNYQTIHKWKTDSRGFFPAYEHGYNLRKRHHLAIGAQEVVWTDYVFWQNCHHKQDLLKVLTNRTPFLVINHPALLGAFTKEDFERLTDYDAIEVLNHHRNSEELWDAALSAGRLSWMVGNDDTHDISNPGQTCVCWTMVNAMSTGQDDIISAMKAGRMYGVEGKSGVNENALRKVEVRADSLIVELERPAREISYICDRGEVFRTFSHTNESKAQLEPRNTYIRIEIQNDQSRMYLNPIVRFDGHSVPTYSAAIDVLKTWVQRFSCLTILVIISVLPLGIRRIMEKKRSMGKRYRDASTFS